DRVRAQNEGVLFGWETNAKTRPRMIARISEAVLERAVGIHGRSLLKPLTNFGGNESGRLEGLDGHDDLLFALGIALVSRSENYVETPAESAWEVDPVSWKDLGLDVQEAPYDLGQWHRQRLAARTQEVNSWVIGEGGHRR